MPWKTYMEWIHSGKLLIAFSILSRIRILKYYCQLHQFSTCFAFLVHSTSTFLCNPSSMDSPDSKFQILLSECSFFLNLAYSIIPSEHAKMWISVLEHCKTKVLSRSVSVPAPLRYKILRPNRSTSFFVRVYFFLKLSILYHSHRAWKNVSKCTWILQDKSFVSECKSDINYEDQIIQSLFPYVRNDIHCPQSTINLSAKFHSKECGASSIYICP